MKSGNSSIPGMSGWTAIALFVVMLSACGGGGGTLPVSETPPEPEMGTPPEPQPTPEPTPLPARAAGKTVRAHATQSSITTLASHPLGEQTTIYRAETLEPATNPRTASSWETAEYNAQAGLGLIRASTGYAARTTGRPGGGGITIAIVGRRIPTDNDEILRPPRPGGRDAGADHRPCAFARPRP